MFPKFLGIGAQKAGTTWLHQMLSAHPDVWLPHLKELHYFDRKYPVLGAGSAQSPGHSTPRVAGRLASRLRGLNFAKIRSRLSIRRWPDVKWELRYVLGDWTDEWYASLFDAAGDRVPGEITPAYSCLRTEAIEDIQRLMPAVRLILLLRNPIERAWSHAKMDLASTLKSIGQYEADKRLIAHFDGPASRLRGDYVGIIDQWLKVFSPDQLFVGFYDEITDAPTALLKRICRHIGVSTDESHLPPAMDARVNASADTGLPRHLQVYLARVYVGSIEVLARRYGTYPEHWLESARSLLNEYPVKP
jgi:hypothetical protein